MKKNELLTTRDYTIFSIHPLNRDINDNHVKSLMKSMIDRLAFTFITCNERMQIIDGQHRFEALKRLGQPINYIITESKNQDMILQNTNQKNWKIDDYIYYYAKADYKSYQDLVKLQSFYKIPYSIIIGVIGGTKTATATSRDNSSLAKSIKNGSFAFDKEKLITRLDKIKKAFDLIGKKGIKRSVIGGLNFVMNNPNYNQDRMISQLEKYPQLFEQKRTAEDYIGLFEMIYNFHQQKKVNLRF